MVMKAHQRHDKFESCWIMFASCFIDRRSWKGATIAPKIPAFHRVASVLDGWDGKATVSLKWSWRSAITLQRRIGQNTPSVVGKLETSRKSTWNKRSSVLECPAEVLKAAVGMMPLVKELRASLPEPVEDYTKQQIAVGREILIWLVRSTWKEKRNKSKELSNSSGRVARFYRTS